MVAKGELFPAVSAMDQQGRSVDVGYFNQRSHVILISTPNALEAELAALKAEVKSRQKTWDWLHAIILFTSEPFDFLSSGAYAIDRYGRFIDFFPITPDVWDLLEKEFIYHEARHC